MIVLGVLLFSCFLVKLPKTLDIVFQKDCTFEYYRDGHVFFEKPENFDGVSTVVSDLSVEDVLNTLMIEIQFCEHVENVVCFYGYSPQIASFVTLNGKRVNVQIASNGEYLKIGSPLIFGSF